NRQQNLLELSPEALFGRQEEHPAELLGQGACSLRLAPLEQVRGSRPENADDVHSPVVLEMAILDGEDGVLEHLGNLAVGDDHAAFEREAPDHGAVVGIKLRHDVRAVVFELPHLREVRRVDEDHSAQGAHADREQQQGEEYELTENPAAENWRGSRLVPAGPGTRPVLRRKPRISHSTPSLCILGPWVATVKPGRSAVLLTTARRSPRPSSMSSAKSAL